jgi:uncharacterized membrane protein YccC
MALAVGSSIGARQIVRSVQNIGIDDVLGTIGLQRRRSTMARLLPTLGWIGLGSVVGAGAALLLAPSSGKQLRERVSHQLEDAKVRMDQELRTMEQGIAEHASRPNNSGPG